ncbi:hypothetical protein D4A92_09370 [Rhizobium rosettiformans]|uniref:DUF4424 domain-containing protein n=1 Tax=Rhizobium rosettiformans TaxID=1368430 RepID=A0ABX7EQV3_9HYPH|nr:hypothetical protein [Rhizobium rosettiformans]QRF49990.1 hypothetical protein D4A92_00285 [Rhizobium rosettiformans]QRF51627.1 hypothetical protein D4A92_09370 [Rhizobium rosettiformans]
MIRAPLLASLSCLVAFAASAEETAPTPATGDFNCFERAAFQEASADTPQIRINNFSVRETKSFLSNGAFAIEVSYAVANRIEKPVSISADFALFDGQDTLLAALSAGPSLDTVQPGKTETGSGDTLVDEGTLGRAERICLRIYTAWSQ